MYPLTITAARKTLALLTTGDALTQAVALLAESANTKIQAIASTQVIVSGITADIADKNIQLTYPRVCLYSYQVKNTQVEKFRSLSGTVAVTAEIWASENFVEKTEESIHYYTEALTGILRNNIGDWNDGLFFSGAYEVQIQPLKIGGYGYVQAAKVTCVLNVSRN